MKKLFFSVCAASLLLFSACSKDDDKDASEMSSAEISSMIIGTWQIIQEEWSYKEEWDMEYDETYEDTGSWRIEGNTLIGYDESGEEEQEWVIEKLTKDELIMYVYVDYGNGDYEKDRIIAKKIK